MGEVNGNVTEGFAGRAKFAVFVALGAALASAHIAVLTRVHHLPFSEGLPQEFHPRVLRYSTISFVAFLALVLPLARVIPASLEYLWRRMTMMLGVSLWPLAAGLAARDMTSLLEGSSSPGWGWVALIVLTIAIATYACLSLFDALTRSFTASRTLWGFATVTLVSVCYYLTLNAATETFDQFALSLQYLILFSASLITGLGVIIIKRHSRWWARGSAIFFATVLLTSVPFSFGETNFLGGSELKVGPDKPRQIILITVDTLRADVLSSYGGSDSASTPNLDSLAADGVMFMQATTYAPWTLPSMASLFTGEDPRVHRCINSTRRLPERFRTPAEYFNEAGFHTKAIVQNAFLKEGFRFSQGFDEFNYMDEIELGIEINPLRRNSLLRSRRYDVSSTTFTITVEAIRYLRRMKDRPYFLWIHYFDPHKPYAAPERFIEAFGRPSRMDREGIFEERDPSSEPEYANIQKSRYKSEVRYVDECIGRILDELKTQGVYDPSLIAMTSDHGEEFYEHGGYTHGHTLYNELLHVPLLWKSPGNTGGGEKVTQRVPMAGIRAALLESMEFEPESHDKLLAPSILPFIEGSNSIPDIGPILGGAIDPSLPQGNSIIASEWKLIERAGLGPELYDLSTDPGEKINLYETHPDKAAELKSLMSNHEAQLQERSNSLQMSPEESNLQLDAQTQDELRNLGYLK